MKLVIVGGVAGGMSAATRARRLDEKAQIVVFEKGPDVSFANCGLPYFIGGTIEERDRLLVVTPPRLRSRFNIDVRTLSEVTAVDPKARTVTVRDLQAGRTYTETYERLILAPGAEPVRPPIPGLDDPEVYTLRNLQDMDRIHAAAETAVGERRALVIGGGFIGLEMAENLAQRGFRVAVAEMLPQVMPPIDPEMAAPVHKHLSEKGVALFLSNAVQRVERRGDALRATLKDGSVIECEFIVLSVGIRPSTALARQAGLEIGETGGIRVDEHMRTSDPGIYAVGDAVESLDYVTRRPVLAPLAGPANRQGRVAADNVCGRDAMFRGVQGTAIVKVFDLTVANTGASEKTLKRLGIRCEKVYVHPSSRAGYYPGAGDLTMKLLFSPEDGRVLGAQIVGTQGVDKRIDVLATAIQAHLTVFDLEEAELAYAPPYGSAKDPVNMAGFVAANTLRGDVGVVHADAVPEGTALIDVRTPGEFAAGHLPGALNVPLDEMRSRLAEVPRDRPLAVYCGVGLRAYVACRILQQEGLRPANLSGGLKTWMQFHPKPSSEAEQLRRAFTVEAE
jgi:NADPH-dependent 2,4-dienoyl-CoA reductase/sulfur reductase-like enzyme/rhodanese-related sulfurtransferase